MSSLAQEEDDLFDILDMESSEPSKPEASSAAGGLLGDLAGNLSGDVRLRWEQYGARPPADTNLDAQTGLAEAWLKGETFADWGDWRLDVSGWLDIGNAELAYAGAREFLRDTDNRRRMFQLNDMYVSWAGEHVDITAGLKVFRNGLSTLWSPADVYTPVDLSDPVNARRLGTWLVEMDYALGAVTLTGVVFPVRQENKIPGKASRWLVNSDDFYFQLLDEGGGLAAVVDESPKVSTENFSYLTRIKAVMRGWDLFASAYYGLNPYYVLKKTSEVLIGPIPLRVYTKTTTKVFQFASGFSTTSKAWEFHGEGNYNWSHDRREDSYLGYVGGLTYTWSGFGAESPLDTVLLTAEYAGEWLDRPQAAKGGYSYSSEGMRVGQNDLIARLEIQTTEDWEFVFAGHYELSKAGHLQQAQASYNFTPDLKGTLGVDVFGGSTSSYHGRWDCNDRVYFELAYSF